MKSHYALLFYFLISQASALDWEIKRQGNLSARLTSYTEKEVPNYGQMSKAELEQTTIFPSIFPGNFSAKNQLRWKSNSLLTDISQKSINQKKDSYEIGPGDNYIRYKDESTILQMGYQDIVWGEAYGFNYADIINPKDLRETLFSDAGENRLPLLLVNSKMLIPSGSLQIIYSPEPRFSKTLPLDLFIGDKFSQTQLEVIKEKTPKIFKTSEAGGKLALSFNDIDTSLFHYSYIDRDPTYTVISGTATTLTFQENHSRLHTTGFSLTKTLGSHVLRSDIVYTQNKLINYIESNQVKSFQTSSTNLLLSLDSPSFNDYSGVFIFAQSHLQDIKPSSVRNQDEQFAIIKLTKSFNEDKSFELAYTHEFKNADNSIQPILNWPLNNTLECKLGGQFYWGNTASNFNKYKKLNSVFLSLKNYFEL